MTSLTSTRSSRPRARRVAPLIPPWRAVQAALVALALVAPACGGDDGDGGKTDTSLADTGGTDTTADTGGADTVTPIEYTQPDWFPAKGTDANEVLALPDLGLEGNVRVVYDDRGIPHIYGDNVNDLAAVQGFVIARDRIFQLHTLRAAASGRLAEFNGTGSLSGDLYLRMIALRKTAVAMAEKTKTDDPELYAAMEAYARGVNAFLTRMKAGLEKKPVEVQVFGADIIDPWTPADTMTIVRLQTWDLGFDLGDLDRLNDIKAIKAKNDGTALEGIEASYLNVEPIREVASYEKEGGASQTGSFDLEAVLAKDFFQKLRKDQLERTLEVLKPLEFGPHHPFRGPEYGSNNWIVSGAHTASGKPIVANDTHLSLRNPAVFYNVHLNNTLAGGNINVNGVQFAGAPGIVLGHNDHAAWGATVFDSDVTDVYVEKLNEDGTKVWYDGAWVDLVPREETFRFPQPAGGKTCKEVGPAWLAGVDTTETVENFTCALTLTFMEVPHHGPIIPWSYGQNSDGEPIAMSFRWTGLEATGELSAIWGLGKASSVAELKAALDKFGCGAQNWVFGLDNGDIGWYPSHNLPIRKHIQAGNTDYPPFLPMPGDTSDTQWDGFIPRAELPQVVNPAQGWLATANNDPVGNSFDNDPFNDGRYLGFRWTVGYREGRIQDLLSSKVAAGGITQDDMLAIQSDHHSNFGETLTPFLLDALAAAKDGTDTVAQGMLTSQTDVAQALLEGWRDGGFWAPSGVGAAAGSDEAKYSAATAIFNAWVVFLGRDVLGPHDLRRGGDSVVARLLWRAMAKPETMAGYDAEKGDTVLWDPDLSDATEVTRTQAMVKALVEALDFLADASAVGPAQSGGFGTSDTSMWRWGALHTLTLAHNVSPAFNIPPSEEWPNGFPRPCDSFCVDAAHPGLSDTRFTFTSGPAIRNSYELVTPTVFRGVIPGGESEQPTSPHYRDAMDLWVQNKSPEIPFTVDDVLAKKESIVDFVATPAE
ncbi:MAG: penicillin acylase family protein [Deltaproteobacteria bacterium]|nr:penicillin acylase family protein [Deltaproteobacteria bacterium]